MYTLKGVSGVANFITLMKSLKKTETPISISPRALFQRQPFSCFLLLHFSWYLVPYGGRRASPNTSQ